MSKQNNTGIGFTGLLTIAFIVLKLTGQISWSWWWVFSPLWINALIGIAVVLITTIITVIGALGDRYE